MKLVKRWQVHVTLLIAILVVLMLVLNRYSARQSPHIAPVHIGDQENYVKLPGYAFVCVEAIAPVLLDCETQFENQPLQIAIKGTANHLQGCTVQYAGAAVSGCSVGFSYAPRAKPGVLLADKLGVSDARLAELRRQDPFTNTSDSTWNSLLFAITIIITGAFVLILWNARRPQNVQGYFKVFGGSAGLGVLTLWVLALSLLGMGYVD